MNRLIIRLGSSPPSHFRPRCYQVVAIPSGERWMLYQRLLSLGIICHYSAYHPLTVELSTLIATVQMWSVLKQISSSRQDLIDWLNCCWHSSIP